MIPSQASRVLGWHIARQTHRTPAHALDLEAKAAQDPRREALQALNFPVMETFDDG